MSKNLFILRYFLYKDNTFRTGISQVAKTGCCPGSEAMFFNFPMSIFIFMIFRYMALTSCSLMQVSITLEKWISALKIFTFRIEIKEESQLGLAFSKPPFNRKYIGKLGKINVGTFFLKYLQKNMK